MLISAALLLMGAAINGVGIVAPAAPKGQRVVSADPLWRKCRYVTPVWTHQLDRIKERAQGKMTERSAGERDEPTTRRA